MKVRPILFSGPMIRAILGGTKTQTRRIVKHPLAVAAKRILSYKGQTEFDCVMHDDAGGIIHCPYGQPGDRLWVRETWDFLPDGTGDEPNAAVIRYWAGGEWERRLVPDGFNPLLYGHERRRPSIHMPRWASRITLEITGVRIERLQDISEADAIAEGIERGNNFPGLESINGLGTWDANPWVWAIDFARVDRSMESV